MPATARAEVEALVDALHGERLRVWSIVITFFGDAVVPRGGEVWLGVVSALTERLRINPGTLGAALSRLTAEGWLERERVGRRSRYRLDSRGLEAFDEAARRVYGLDDDDWSGAWSLRMAPAGSEPEAWQAAGFGVLGPDLYLRPERTRPRPAPEGIEFRSAPPAESIPELAARAFPLERAEAGYARFTREFLPLRRALEEGAKLDPDDAIAARTLLVHAYRRLVLRSAPLPAAALPPHGERRECRIWVGELYRALLPASEAWLGAPPGVPEGLPPASKVLRARFGGSSATARHNRAH